MIACMADVASPIKTRTNSELLPMEGMKTMSDIMLEELQEKLEYSFNNPGLLKDALTHSSYANENKKDRVVSNERLEFLGDSVLGLTVAAMIFDGNPDMSEGQMTRLRAELVCERSLAGIAADIDIGKYLQLGRGEDKGDGRKRPSILADAVEAVIAAIYLDGGFKPVEKLIKKHFASLATIEVIKNTDYKTELQEIVQEKAGQTLSYHITDESGPDHMKSFSVEVRLNAQFLGCGTGKSKKVAEQVAAKSALEKLKK